MYPEFHPIFLNFQGNMNNFWNILTHDWEESKNLYHVAYSINYIRK